MATKLPSKDPNSVEPYFIIWCGKDGTNDGTASDTGELQSATILTATWTVPAGITKDSSNTASVTISGVTYPVNTVCTIWLSAGTVDTDYELLCRNTTSDLGTLDKSIIIPVRVFTLTARPDALRLKPKTGSFAEASIRLLPCGSVGQR